MTAVTSIDRIRRALARALAAQTALWAEFERIAPDPDPHLHWEPTPSGWRLYGELCEFRPLR